MDKTKKRDITVRILSVIIAFILWTYVASVENPNVSQDIVNIPVKLVNVDSLAQSGFVLISYQKTINLTVSGRKQDVLALKADNFTAEANIGGSYRVKGVNSVPVDIKDWPKNIQMPNQPLYISVELDELVERSFPVKVITDGQPKEGYSSLTAVTKPTDVLLKGASRYIGSVNSVVVKPNIAGAVADVTASLPVSILDKAGKPIYDPTETVSKIEATPNLVDITVPIQRSKEVAINVPTGGKLPSGVFMKEILAVPSKVTLVGPDAIVGGISSINTDPIDLGSITGNATRQVKLNIPAGVTVSNNVQNVNVNITVETTTTRTFNVPVSYINRPDGLKADLITNTIAVTTSGQASFLDSIAPSSITAVIDLSNVPANDGEYEFTPKLTYPQGLNIKDSDISPQKVKVRITKVQG